MNIRFDTRIRCRTRKVRKLVITSLEMSLIEKLGVDIKRYCKHTSVRKRMVVHYKFGGPR